MLNKKSKQIAKNTMMLYFRMLFTMLITLYTSRIVLNTLGVADYGIYNVVGGIVVMFSFLNSAMAASTQRFISYELGRNNIDKLKLVFSTSLNIHILIGIIIVVLAETIGIWFLNTKMNIPPERMEAARWVYQFAIFSFFVSIIQVPYNACIVAHEKMNVYAYVSILEVLLKLFIVFILTWITFDKLKLYGILIFAVTIILANIYRFFCKRKFEECTYHYIWDQNLFKVLIKYSAWNIFGNLSYVGYTQGLNILLNIFFGPVINAARGISSQIQGAIISFITNFQLAVSPQIVKSYASGDYTYMKSLIFNSSRYSYFLLFFIAFPVLLKTEYILTLWLKIVPENAVVFTRLMIINSLIDVFANPLGYAIQATGKIKTFQILVGGVLLLNIPISYILLELKFDANVVFYVSIALSAIAIFLRLSVVSRVLCFSKFEYLSNVTLRMIAISILSSILPLIFLDINVTTFMDLIISIITSSISIIVTIYLIGLNKTERSFLLEKFKSFVK